VFYSNSTTSRLIWHHTCISYKVFYFWGPNEVCGCGCGKIFKKHTCVVWECAERNAIVCRVCGCAKSGCTQILWSEPSKLLKIAKSFKISKSSKPENYFVHVLKLIKLFLLFKLKKNIRNLKPLKLSIRTTKITQTIWNNQTMESMIK
jgi:hypothetical protein